MKNSGRWRKSDSKYVNINEHSRTPHKEKIVSILLLLFVVRTDWMTCKQSSLPLLQCILAIVSCYSAFSESDCTLLVRATPYSVHGPVFWWKINLEHPHAFTMRIEYSFGWNKWNQSSFNWVTSTEAVHFVNSRASWRHIYTHVCPYSFSCWDQMGPARSLETFFHQQWYWCQLV